MDFCHNCAFYRSDNHHSQYLKAPGDDDLKSHPMDRVRRCLELSENSEIVLFIDWDQERWRIINGTLCSSGIDFKYIENAEAPVPHCSSVALIPAFWPPRPSTQTGESRMIAILRELCRLPSRPEIIVFGCKEQGISVTDSCRCLLEGARYLVEGADPHVLESKIRECLELRRKRQSDLDAFQRFIETEFGVIYQSEEMHKVLCALRKAATVKSDTVLLTGPTGSGKQKLAETLHRMDPWRRNAPMITLNCAAIPAPLAESELFGHRRGSYTGASADRMGCFRAANGGTLLLDEISELDLSLQPKLLRALEEHKVRSIGQDSEIPVDVRVIATTNRDLRKMVASRQFRMDLYQRLAMLEITVPPLARRPRDVLLLLTFFISKHSGLYVGGIKSIHPGVMEILSRYPFEGNVRELENLVRYILFNKSSGDTIQVEDLPRHILERVVCEPKQPRCEAASRYLTSRIFQDKMSLNEVLEECESIMLKAALEFTGGNRSAAAGSLQISERTLYNKLRHCATRGAGKVA